MNEPPGEFAQQLRSLREAQGLSVRALASLIGVSSVTIWKWEKGESKPRARLIPPLAKALDVQPAQLTPARTAMEAIAAAEDEQGSEPSATPGPGSEDAANQDQPEALADVIARAKQMIAEASGTGPNNITILIEY